MYEDAGMKEINVQTLKYSSQYVIHYERNVSAHLRSVQAIGYKLNKRIYLGGVSDDIYASCMYVTLGLVFFLCQQCPVMHKTVVSVNK